MKNIIITIIFSAFALSAADQYSGGYAGAYQRMAQDARTAALGNSAASLVNDIGAVAENPALAASLSGRQIVSSVQFLSLDRNLNSIGLGFPVKPSAGLALIWQHAGVSDIQGRDFSNNPTEIYSTAQDAFYVSFSNRFTPWLSIGLTTKIMLERIIETSASGMGLEVGALITPLSTLSIALSARDVKSDITWDTRDVYEFGGQRIDELPARYILSASWKPVPSTLFTVSYKASDTVYPTLHAGTEFVYSPYLQFRAGLDDGMPVLGFGTEYEIFGGVRSRMDYAFVYGRALEGTSHLFSFVFYY